MGTSLIEIGLSFLEGLALIASPCILPVLPIVLAASVSGERRRPFGIILGFVIAFTLFALLSRKLVMVLHIDLDYIKFISLIFLALFGLVLLSEKLSKKFSEITQGLANLSNLSTQTHQGLGSGLMIGMMIGLVWTPCAGPILAAALVQIIRQQSDLQALLLIAAFAVGAGVPMFVIAVAGRRIITKLGFFTHHAEAVRKTFGGIIIMAVIFIASGLNVQAWAWKTEASISKPQLGVIHGIRPYPAPQFSGIEKWFNSRPLSMEALKGKVVLIDFWTYSCINCLRTLPYITDWDRKYRDEGLVIVGVHAPEFEFEKNPANVKKAIAAQQIAYPVALDNHLDTWTSFNNRYWPAHYLIDRDGRVVYTHFGEGDYDITEKNIRFLIGLDNINPSTSTATSSTNNSLTPETYLGRLRASGYRHDTEILARDSWGLSGKWRTKEEYIISEAAGAAIRLHFKAAKVYLVMGVAGTKPITISIGLNGNPVKQMSVEQHKLYTIIDQQDVEEGQLEITVAEPGLEAYAFTFGE